MAREGVVVKITWDVGVEAKMLDVLVERSCHVIHNGGLGIVKSK